MTNASVSSDDIDWINKERARVKAENERRKYTPGFVYLMKSSNGYYKIGRATNVDIRNKQHLRDYPIAIDVIHFFFCRNCVKGESYLLKMFGDRRLQGEWFELEPDDVKFITSITDEIAKSMFR